MTAAALASGYVADALLGDPRRLHPVAGFGARSPSARSPPPTRPRGLGGSRTRRSSSAGRAAAGALAGRVAGRSRVLALVTWASLGGRSLTRVAERLAGQLEADDLAGARETLPSLCGRDPHALDAAGLSRAALESVAENTSDAVVGALFWGALAGPGGVTAYRAANTLDAMVGRRDDRYREFGWAAARLDDALNWLPARLTAALAALCSAPPAGRRGDRPARRHAPPQPECRPGGGGLRRRARGAARRAAELRRRGGGPSEARRRPAARAG